jgi:hypothetical protein
MAATNYTPIQLYHSTTLSAVPVNTNLVDGELAINITDGKLYYKDNSGVVQVIATKATGTIGGSTTQVQYNLSGSLAGSANFTFDGTTATINALNLTNALGAAYGGTAQSSWTTGDLLYASGSNTLAKLGIGLSTYILTSNGTIPGWSAPSAISVSTATNLAGGAAGSVPYQSGAGATTFLAIGTANQVVTSTGTAPQWSSGLSITTLTASDAVTFSATTQNIALGTSQTSGTFTVGGASQTGNITLDQSTKAHTLNIGTGATENATTKTINIGTGGVSGSTTTITIGAATGTTTTVNGTLNATTLDLTNLEVTNIKAKDGTAAMSIADSTGVVSITANPVLSGGTQNGVPYLNGSQVLTTGSALTFDGTNLGVGTTSPNSPAGATQVTLHISNSTAGTSPGVHITNGDTGTNPGDGSLIFVGNAATKGTTSLNIYNQENSPICFFTDTTEKARISADGTFRVKGAGTAGSTDAVQFSGSAPADAMRLTSGGSLYVGRTTAAWDADEKVLAESATTDAPAFVGSVTAGANTAVYISWNNADSGTRVHMRFADSAGGNVRGSITSDGANTAFNTSSDYRLKDNLLPLTNSGAFIDALKPKTWTWKESGKRGVGFIAHEVQEVSPGSVVGEKDAVDADGKPVMQAMEYGSAEFIANIIAELQSLRARVAQLEQGN